MILAPAVGALAMSVSTIVVAINAMLLRRIDLRPDAVRPDAGSTRPAVEMTAR